MIAPASPCSLLRCASSAIAAFTTIAAITILLPVRASAVEPGGRDASFGGSGEIAVDFVTPGADYQGGVLEQLLRLPDGRLVGLGTVSNAGINPELVPRGFLGRWLANGTLDTAFGDNGYVGLPGARGGTVIRLLRDDAGRLLVATTLSQIDPFPSNGGTTSRHAVVRFTSSGRLDASWGVGGIMMINAAPGAGSQQTLLDIAKLPGGRSGVLYLRPSDRRLTILQLEADGQPVAGFGSNGVVSLSTPAGGVSAMRLMSLADGKILLYGCAQATTANTDRPKAFFGRISATGAWDSSVGGGSGYTLSVLGNRSADPSEIFRSELVDAIELGDGRVVATGYWYQPSSNTKNQTTVVRYLADGSRDTTFGTSDFGYTNVLTYGSWDDPTNILRLGDGSFLVSGRNGENGQGGYVQRLSANGATRLWRRSIVSPFSSMPMIFDGAGGIITGGGTVVGDTPGDPADLTLRRYDFSGNPDTSFAGVSGGVVRSPLTKVEDLPTGLVLAGDRLWLAGTATPGSATAAYGLGGQAQAWSLDGSTRLVAGLSAAALAEEFTRVNGLAVDDAGRPILLLVKTVGNVVGTPSFRLARFTSAGDLDSSFGSSGLSTAVSNANASRAKMARLSGGRILVAVTTGGPLQAYTASGTLDTSFASSGSLTTSGHVPSIASIVPLSSGGFLLVGQNFNNRRARIARYSATGVLDTSFGATGIAEIDISNATTTYDAFLHAAVDDSGRIVAVGQTDTGKAAIVRLTAGGIIDSSFDGDGRLIATYSSAWDRFQRVIIQPDGRILAIGTADHNGFARLVVARFLEHGAVDASFGTAGVVIEDRAEAVDAVLTSSGRLLVTARRDGDAVILAYATQADESPIAILVDANEVAVDEGSSTTVALRLASPPPATVVVQAALVPGGDSDLALSGSTTFSFSPSTWDQPQVLTITAANDVDTINGTANLRLIGTGLETRELVVREIDNDTVANQIVVSVAQLVVPEGGSSSLNVRLSAAPASSLTVSSAIVAGSDPSFSIAAGSSLTFTTGNWDQPQSVVIASDEDADAINGAGFLQLTASSLTTRIVELVQADSSGANTAPGISSIADQVISAGASTAPLSFTVTDAQTAAGSLVVTAISNDAELVPPSGLVLAGTANDRSLTITPSSGRSGSAIITVTVSDGILTASTAFLLTVLDDTPVVQRRVAFRLSNAAGGLATVAITLFAPGQDADGSSQTTRSDGFASEDGLAPASPFPGVDSRVNQEFTFIFGSID